MIYKIRVNGEPVPKARPRHTKSGHTYTPATTRDFEAKVRDAFIQGYPGEYPSTKPIAMNIEFGTALPKSYPKGDKRLANAGRLRPTKKPDIDNLIKSVLDGLNQVAYQDDKQVVEVVATKWYAPEGQEGYTEISISELD